ncbi:DnaJ protein 60 [Fasciola gigantica]|uniref:DnaJ homolog subfamily B member 9 n=1 Tax=Fasciola gigantica TaxID=46835 RepID=A0A504Z1Z8_FASGI|nr:DnaJ protein 60 [Fasciola gigantica]
MLCFRRVSRSSVIIASRCFASSHNYYDVLCVKQTASTGEIRQAFLELSKKHHPDKPHGNAELFKSINEAYSVLSQKHLRADYDASLASGFAKFSANPPHPADYEFWKQDVGAHRYPYTVRDRMGRKAPRRDYATGFFHSLVGFTILSYLISFFYFVRLTHASTSAYPLHDPYGARYRRKHFRRYPGDGT